MTSKIRLAGVQQSDVFYTAKGKRLGRPKISLDSLRIVALRRAGRSWSEIALQTGWTKGTVQRAF